MSLNQRCIPSVISLLSSHDYYPYPPNPPQYQYEELHQIIDDGKRVVYKSKFPTTVDEMVNNPSYCMYDTLFVVSSTDELGRRQITDTIRKELKKALSYLGIACTKTSSFSCGTKRETTCNKCLQMSIFCKREHAARVRELLTTLIESRKSRKYFTYTKDGGTKPGVPIYFSEFYAKDPIYLHETNTIKALE